MNPLFDKDFLKDLDQNRNKEIYARIIALTFSEYPIEQIEGRVTGGSINIDGTSTVRRTCNITLVAQEMNINDFYWGLTNKFKLEIGLKNTINSNYPDIIWFPQGIYIITGFNTAISTNNYTITINGKDKMCMLNGDIGGALPASVDFGKMDSYDTIYSEVTFEDSSSYIANKYYILNPNYSPSDAKSKQYIISNEEYDKKQTYYEKDDYYETESIPIKTIIREAVHTYADESYHNIIINDLEDYGLELLEYRGDTPLYFLYKDGSFVNMTANGKTNCVVNGVTKPLEELTGNEIYNLVDGFDNDAIKVTFPDEKEQNEYLIAKVEYGETAGYRLTDLTYSGDLISSVGENLTSILDKIKNMLGEFEYFYDLEGHFVFQAKQTYVNSSWNTIVNIEGDKYVDSAATTSASTYSFEDNNLITAFQNSPTLTNLRNDFSVWGQRTSTSSGATIPIHARYAIDTKPTEYNSIDVTLEEAKAFKSQFPDIFIGDAQKYIQSSVSYTDEDYDWREIIYQMAMDYYAYGQVDEFYSKVAAANPTTYPNGKTGYEKYYVDMQGFWRQLYDPDPDITYSSTGGYYAATKEWVDEDLGTYKIVKEWVDYVEDTDNPVCDYYLPISASGKTEAEINKMTTSQKSAFYSIYSDNYKYWNKNVVESPELLNFWIDFMDGMESYSIPVVGDRSKTVNDNDVTSIYFRETPNVIFTSYSDYSSSDIKSGYTYVFLTSSLENLFTISAQGKSAKDEIDDMLYNYTYCIENITITAIPVYYLQPNTRIFVHDENSKINGEYIMTKITLPLAYNGTMSITATKAAERLY